jgi:dolichol kinase
MKCFFKVIVVAAELLPIAGLQAMVIMAGCCRHRLMIIIIVRMFLFCYLLIRHVTVSLSKLFVVADIARFRKRLERDEKKKKKKKKRSTSNLLDVRFV